MTIATILSGARGPVVSIAPDATVGRAVALLAERRIGALPVIDPAAGEGAAGEGAAAVLGIVSERDVIHALAADGAAALDRPVSSVMTAPVVSVAPGDSVIAALALMTRRRIRHLPVIDDGALAGFVSIGDLVKYRIDRIEADAEAMRAYIQAG